MTRQFEVTVEDVIAVYETPDNGSGPLWCMGSPTIARHGGRVFATVMEKSTDVPPLCNTRWQLFMRSDQKGGPWERAATADDVNEREPCPLCRLPDGRIVLSTNPAQEVTGIDPNGRQSCRCVMQLREYDADDPASPPRVSEPVWDRPYVFSEHSYRGIAADRLTGDLLLVKSEGYDCLPWTYRDAAGNWSHSGVYRFPLRGCYQHIGLRNRNAGFSSCRSWLI